MHIVQLMTLLLQFHYSTFSTAFTGELSHIKEKSTAAEQQQDQS